MKIVVHVGPWKTGSTSLQRFFSLNRNFLETNGILYPLGVIHADAHHELPLLLTGSQIRTEYVPALANLTVGGILASFISEAESKSLHTILLSSENFVKFNSDNYSEFIGYIRSSRDCEIEIVYFDFDPKSRLDSYRNEAIRHGEYMSSDASNQLLRDLEGITSYFELATKNHVLKIQRINYESLNSSFDIFKKFMGTSTVFPSEFIERNWVFPDTRENKSMAQKYIEKLNQFNKFNVGEREYRPDCPIIFSDHFPLEKARFLLFYELLMDVRERDSIKNSRTWRMFEKYRLIRKQLNVIRRKLMDSHYKFN